MAVMSACGNQSHSFPSIITPYSTALQSSSSTINSNPYSNYPTHFQSPLDLLSFVALNQQPLPDPCHHQQQHQHQQHTYSPTYNNSNSPFHHNINNQQQQQQQQQTQKHIPLHDMSPVSSEEAFQICINSKDVKENQQQLSRRLSSEMIQQQQQQKDEQNQSKSISESTKSRSQPSRFCHICSRTSSKVEQIACANFATGACRKVVCQKCFEEQNWNWQLAYNDRQNWICPHCRQECPSRAQCAIYKRTNERRRELQQSQRQNKTFVPTTFSSR